MKARERRTILAALRHNGGRAWLQVDRHDAEALQRRGLVTLLADNDTGAVELLLTPHGWES